MKKDRAFEKLSSPDFGNKQLRFDLPVALRTKAGASKAISALFDRIQDTLRQGDKVAIPGFGTFEIADRPARQGRNPQTGATIEIAASKAAKFESGKGLKDALNG